MQIHAQHLTDSEQMKWYNAFTKCFPRWRVSGLSTLSVKITMLLSWGNNLLQCYMRGNTTLARIRIAPMTTMSGSVLTMSFIEWFMRASTMGFTLFCFKQWNIYKRFFLFCRRGIRVMLDNRDRENNEEPVMCSKCNVVFESDTEFIMHYDKNHK